MEAGVMKEIFINQKL